MLGVEHQRQVECVPHRLRRRLAVHHVEEVGRVVEVFARSNQGKALEDPLVMRDERGHLGNHPLSFAHVRGVVGRLGVDIGIEMRLDAYTGPQHVHEVRLLRKLLQKLDQGGCNRTQLAQPCVKLAELAAIGQITVKQQIGCLLVRNVPGQILDLVPSVLQSASTVGPLHVGDCGFVRDDAFKSRMVLVHRLTAHGDTPRLRDTID